MTGMGGGRGYSPLGEQEAEGGGGEFMMNEYQL
jgi:hypothetical protein